MKYSLEKLVNGINNNDLGQRELRGFLAHERNNLAIATVPTVGVFGAEMSQREAKARQDLDNLQSDAAFNVPMLEKLLRDNGWHTETYICPRCNKHRNTKICQMCSEPSEY